MSDKRRLARIQGGGWASSKKKTSVKISPSQDEQTSSNKKFQFKPTVQIRTRPPDIVIRESGTHEISTTPHGISRVVFCLNFLDTSDCDWMMEQLLSEIPWKRESVVIKGEKVTQPRLTAWFGDISYTYSGLTLKPYKFSPLLLALKEKIEIFLDSKVTFNSVLANLYENEKHSIDWHSDDEKSLGSTPIIASLSFGETRVFEMRQKTGEATTDEGYEYVQHVKVYLPSGSLLIMDGATQHDWQHRVGKEYHDRKARINLTFRYISTGS